MMAVYCDELNRRAIIDLDSVEGVAGTDGRLSVTYRCVCGQRGRLLTGRDRIAGGMSGHVSV